MDDHQASCNQRGTVLQTWYEGGEGEGGKVEDGDGGEDVRVGECQGEEGGCGLGV